MMNIKLLYKLSQLVLMACLVLLMTGCRETIEYLLSGAIEEGDEVAFTAVTPRMQTTRSGEENETQLPPYTISIGMFTDDGNQVGQNGTYTTIANDELGTLEAVTPLYWPSTMVAYGFKAEAGSEVLSSDQSTVAMWLEQDRLKTIEKDEKVYKTAKEWKKYNEELSLKGDDDDNKKVPLTLYHQRSLITVILKAGEGVSREALAFDVAKNDLSTEIYSYTTERLVINPLASKDSIHYDADKNGAAADNVSTTRYDAIVEPHNYADGDKASTEPIVRISLSGQKYSFYAGNDSQFEAKKESYNLAAGKHLILTVTLSRDSRKVLMSAQIEDWTEQVTNTICDDYGNAGEPIKIKNRDELIDFLKDETKNKAGNIALITADVNLEETSTKYAGDWSAYNTNDLNCTLSLGGMTLLGNHRFIRELGSAASLQNGTIQIGGTVDAAIATTNNGTIDDVRITTENGTNTYATIAGAVKDNKGTISRCHSSLRVQGDGSALFVGGIAATSLSTASMSAAIDACNVTGSVKGGLKGGGIVGQASGYVTNNSFEYGITLNQDKATHKNIVGEKDNSHSFTADNNAWPTKDENPDLQNATATEHRYDGIIDNEAELKESVKNTYNQESMRYRLAQNITVTEQVGSITYELDGNNKQIATSAMIFNAITGKVHDLTVYVVNTLQSNPTEDEKKAATDGIAPLAFEVHGEHASIEHVKVKMAADTKIQASNPAGLVVWVYGGATVSGCEAKVNLFADVETNITQGRKFAGGLVSTTSWATVTQCIIHSGSRFSGTESSIIYYGGIVGGIEHKEGAGHEAEVTITDCTSFLSNTEMPKKERYGAIIGDAMLGAGTTIATKGCQGNWWLIECNGAGAKGAGNSDETVLGKRNAVQPSESNNW